MLSAFLQRKVEGVSFASAGASLFDLASLKTIAVYLSVAPLCPIYPIGDIGAGTFSFAGLTK